MAKQNEIGKEGEELARTFLVKKGYTVLDTNWRWHHFELDIVALSNDEEEQMLVVAEVKTRSADFLISPQEAVDRAKIRRIVAAADAYVRHHNIDLPVRFDIIALLKTSEGYQIEHLDDAFLAPCN